MKNDAHYLRNPHPVRSPRHGLWRKSLEKADPHEHLHDDQAQHKANADVDQALQQTVGMPLLPEQLQQLAVVLLSRWVLQEIVQQPG